MSSTSFITRRRLDWREWYLGLRLRAAQLPLQVFRLKERSSISQWATGFTLQLLPYSVAVMRHKPVAS